MKSRKNYLFSSESNIKKLKELLDDGKSYEEIANYFHSNVDIIWGARKKFGFTYKFSKSHEVWKEDEIDELRMHLNNKKDYKELEKIFKGRHSTQSISGIIRYRGRKLDLHYQGNKRHFYTRKELEILLEHLKEGYTLSYIASLLGVSHIPLSTVLKNYKLKDPRFSDPNVIYIYGKTAELTGKGSIIKKDDLKKLVEIDNLSSKEIGKLYNISVDTIRRLISSLGLVRNQKKEKPLKYSYKFLKLREILGRDPTREELRRQLHTFYTKEVVEKTYNSQNHSLKLSAKALGIVKTTFKKAMEYNNIPIINSPKISDYPKEFYRKLYVDQKLSFSEIGNIVGLGADTIRKYLTRNFPEGRKYGKYKSRYEVIIASILDDNNIKFEYDYYLSLDGSRKFFIDFRIMFEDREYWIEYNGKQHYKYVRYFYPNPNDYRDQLYRDSYVRKYCKENNIVFLELPYNIESKKRISGIIKKVLFKGIKPESLVKIPEIEIIK